MSEGEKLSRFYIIAQGTCPSPTQAPPPCRARNRIFLAPPCRALPCPSVPPCAPPSGECVCSVKPTGDYAEDMAAKMKTKLLAHDHFGERSLLTGAETSPHTITALTGAKLLFITRRAFEDCVGTPLDDLLEQVGR